MDAVSALDEIKIICEMFSKIKAISMATIEAEFEKIAQYTKPYKFIEQKLNTSSYLFSDIVSVKITLIKAKFLYINQNIKDEFLRKIYLQ